jgi:hypothetical protein
LLPRLVPLSRSRRVRAVALGKGWLNFMGMAEAA